MNKVISRYIASAAVIALVLLILNITVFVLWITRASEEGIKNYDISKIASQLSAKDGVYDISKDGSLIIAEEYQWGLLLDENGNVIWEYELPAEIPRKFNVSEVAGFSRWYLKDYPVKVWRMEDKLLVIGSPKNSIWKLGLEMPENVIQDVPRWLFTSLILNCIVAVGLALIMGIKSYKALKMLIYGIEALGKNEEVTLERKGMFSNISESINSTSLKLKNQEILLSKRDNTRTMWIAGVSHDIRTPLSLVMGYASQLEEDTKLAAADREKAKIIRVQSQKIKKLVSDLNLASKLEYNMYPMKFELIRLSTLLRTLTAEVLNSNLAEGYQIDLNWQEDMEKFSILADEDLMRRAILNIMDNAIVHNPNKCKILVKLAQKENYIELIIEDDGAGFPEEVILKNKSEDKLDEIGNHGLGLIIVSQILKLHGSKLSLKNKIKGCSLIITFEK